MLMQQYSVLLGDMLSIQISFIYYQKSQRPYNKLQYCKNDNCRTNH